MTWDDARARKALRSLFDTAVAAAAPPKALSGYLSVKLNGRCIVAGMGNSAAVTAPAPSSRGMTT